MFFGGVIFDTALVSEFRFALQGREVSLRWSHYFPQDCGVLIGGHVTILRQPGAFCGCFRNCWTVSIHLLVLCEEGQRDNSRGDRVCGSLSGEEKRPPQLTEKPHLFSQNSPTLRSPVSLLLTEVLSLADSRWGKSPGEALILSACYMLSLPSMTRPQSVQKLTRCC